MFDQREWRRGDRLCGPVSLRPPAGAAEVVGWADRAPLTGAWFEAVTCVDPAGLRPAERLLLVAAWERLRRGVEAGFMRAQAAIPVQTCAPDADDGGCPGDSDCEHDWSREELAAVLHIGPVTAQWQLSQSRELVERLPASWAALQAGHVSAAAVRAMARRTVGLQEQWRVTEVEGACLPRLARLTPGAAERLVVKQVDRLRAPEELLLAHDVAVRRETGIRPLPPMEDGLGGAIVVAPAPQIAELLEWCRQFVTRNREAGDSRTVGQRRVDALLSCLTVGSAPQNATQGPKLLLTGPAGDAAVERRSARAWSATSVTAERSGLGGQPTSAALATAAPARTAPPDRLVPPGRYAPGGVRGDPGGEVADAGGGCDCGAGVRGQRVALRLTVSAETLLGGDDPGWLQGWGSLPAALARELAIHPRSIERVLTEPLTGEVLDLTPQRRIPASHLVSFVQARDRFCTAPGCGKTAESTETDHLTPVADGGPTTRANLHALCPRHHRARHVGGWTPRRHADGQTTWLAPSGLSYVTQAPQHDDGRDPLLPGQRDEYGNGHESSRQHGRELS